MVMARWPRPRSWPGLSSPAAMAAATRSASKRAQPRTLPGEVKSTTSMPTGPSLCVCRMNRPSNLSADPSIAVSTIAPGSGGALKAPGQDAFLRVQTVFGFVEYDRVRAVHHLVGDFFAAVCRQAMHEQRIRLGARHQPCVVLVVLEQVMAAGTVAVSHRNPRVGDDAVGACDGLFGICPDRNGGAG